MVGDPRQLRFHRQAQEGHSPWEDSLSRAPHASLPSPEEEKVLVSDEAAVVAAIQAPPGSLRKRSKTTRRGMSIFETFKDGRRSRPPRRRSNCCLLTREGSLPSCLPYIKILPPVSGVFRPKKREPRVSASTSPTPCATGSSRPLTNS